MPSVSSSLISKWNQTRQEKEDDRKADRSKPEHDTQPESKQRY